MNVNVDYSFAESHQEGHRFLVVSVTGKLLPGSEGNEEVNQIKTSLLNQLKSLDSSQVGLILDFIDLEYVFGDSVAALWVEPITLGFSTVICTKGETSQNLGKLIQNSLPVTMCESVEDCIRHLKSADT